MYCPVNGIEVTENFLTHDQCDTLREGISKLIPRKKDKSYVFAILGPVSQINKLTKTCPFVREYLAKVLCKESNYFYFNINYFTTNNMPPSEPHVNEAIPAVLSENGLHDIAQRYTTPEYVNTFYLDVPDDITNSNLTFDINGEHYNVTPKVNLHIRFDGQYEHWASEFKYDKDRDIVRCTLVVDEVQMSWRDYLQACKLQYVDHFVEFDNDNITELELNPSDEDSTLINNK